MCILFVREVNVVDVSVGCVHSEGSSNGAMSPTMCSATSTSDVAHNVLGRLPGQFARYNSLLHRPRSWQLVQMSFSTITLTVYHRLNQRLTMDLLIATLVNEHIFRGSVASHLDRNRKVAMSNFTKITSIALANLFRRRFWMARHLFNHIRVGMMII